MFPGGGVEDGETPEDALRREVQEETSYDLKSFRPLFDHENRGRMEKYFHVAFDGNQNEIKLGGPEVGRQSENNSYRLEWIDRADIGNLNLVPDFAKEWVIKNLNY